jgi:uncharacterized protein YndB with AHSA1/START domain
MTTEARATVHVQRRYDASPRSVFDAWVDPAKVRKWIAAPNVGDEAVKIDLKAKVGHPFRLVVRRGSEEVSHTGEYLEVVPSRRLVFTWVVPVVSKETTLVSVDLSPSPGIRGGTHLALKHERVLPTDTSRTEARWCGILEAIAAIVHP